MSKQEDYEIESFSKLFEITKKFMIDACSYTNLVTETISKDVVRRYITIFNKFNLLKKSNRGNKFNDELIDKNIFNRTSSNAYVISTLIAFKHSSTFNIIKYLFKDSVNETRNQLIYKYDKFLNEKLIPLVDKEKYIKVLKQQIYNYTNTTKLSMEFKINDENLNLVIVEVFIQDETWYIVGYDTNKKKLEIYDQRDIINFDSSSYNNQIEYISHKTIENKIIDFIEHKSSFKNSEETFYIKAPVGIINKLLSSELIKDFEIYYENLNFNYLKENDLDDVSKFSNTKRIKNSTMYLSKINYDIDRIIDDFNDVNDLEYSRFNKFIVEEDYIFKVKTSSFKKDFIKSHFKNQISIINKSSIKTV